MRITKKTIITISLLFFGICAIGNAQTINFANTSFENLKKGSKATKKPFFVYLYTNDCSDCEEMERSTFTNPQLSSVINQQFLAAKIELSTDDGIKLVKKNKVSLAPAFLFYNTKGKLLLQQESALSSQHMLKLLKVLYEVDAELVDVLVSTKLVESKNEERSLQNEEVRILEMSKSISNAPLVADQIVIAKEMKNTLIHPSAKIPVLDQSILNKAEKNKLKSPHQLFDSQSKLTIEPMVNRSPSTIVEAKPSLSKTIKSVPAQAQLIKSEVTHKEIISVVENAVKTPVTIKPKKVSTKTAISTKSKKKDRLIQFGAYTKYDDVLKGMYKLKRKIDTPLTILEEMTKGRIMYKLVGSKELTQLVANNLSAEFITKGIDCFVRKTN